MNKDGNISRDELEQGMVKCGKFSQEEAKTAFDIAGVI